MEKRYLSFEELGNYLGISAKTLRNWKNYHPEKLPPHVAITKCTWRFDIYEVDKWLIENAKRA